MSYNDRIDAAQSLIQQHNEAVGGEGKPGFIAIDPFIQCLKITGATSEERLSSLSHEDILACMPDFNGVKPRLLARDVANVFRDSQTPANSSDKSRPVSAKKAEKMLPEELIKAFDPTSPNNPVGKRLQEESRGQPFLVYGQDRIINGAVSLKLLMELKRGFPARADYEVNPGEIVRVYPVGVIPEDRVDENPIYENRPLRPDGTCDQTGRSWEGISLEDRQLVRLIIDHEAVTVNLEFAHNILDTLLEPNGIQKLKQRYRNAALQFNEKKRAGTLPRLTIQLGAMEQIRQAPCIKGGKQVVWAKSPSNTYHARDVVIGEKRIDKDAWDGKGGFPVN